MEASRFKKVKNRSTQSLRFFNFYLYVTTIKTEQIGKTLLKLDHI